MRIVLTGNGVSLRALALASATDPASAAHELVLICEDPTLARGLARELGLAVLVGDASRLDVLRDAELEHADVVFALADDEPRNLLTCVLAKRQFAVGHTVCLVHSDASARLCRTLGVDTAISLAELLRAHLPRARSSTP